MATTNQTHEGSALFLCILLMLAMAAVYTQLHERYTLFTQTVYEREQYLKLRATAQALISCALATVGKNFAHYSAYKNYQEQLHVPIDHQQEATAVIIYNLRDTPKGKVVSIDVNVTHKQRTCSTHASIQRVQDERTGEVQKYVITDWCIS